MATVSVGRLSVCCMSGGHNPARLASILSLFGSVADEIVVAVEESRALATHEAVGQVADRVLSFPPTESPDQPIPWLFGQCSGKWIFNIDDDEVPSPALIEMLPEMVARRDITHAWIARRWLYPSTDYLPGGAAVEHGVAAAARSSRTNDSCSSRTSSTDLSSLTARALFIDAPLWHLDTSVNPVERRRLKAIAYEHARPGMTISGRSHNQGLYVPELVPNVAVALVPCADKVVIDAVVACERAGHQTEASIACLRVRRRH